MTNAVPIRCRRLSLVITAVALGAPVPSRAAVLIEHCGYIGGDAAEDAFRIAADAAGNSYVAGTTSSTEATFPVVVGPDFSYNGGPNDAYVSKVTRDGSGLVWAGYVGGAGRETDSGLAVDASGNVFLDGYTESSQATFPVAVGPDLSFNGTAADEDAWVARITADGTGLTYAGYIGGSELDGGYGIDVDDAGNAYVTGATNSDETTFPVTVGPDLTFNQGPGGTDAFVGMVRADGTGLVYAGYIGGTGGTQEGGFAISVDPQRSAYVAGRTDTSSFPVVIGPDLTFNGGGADGFVARVLPDGSGLVFAGFIGGSAYEEANGIGVDSAGSACVAGTTMSDQASFPVAVGPDLTFGGPPTVGRDAFVAKVRADGTGLVWAGYVGGAARDDGYSVAVDPAGNAYLTGWTYSSQATLPVSGGPDLTLDGVSDAFVAKVLADGTGFAWAGYIGGDGSEAGMGIAVDAQDRVHVSGATGSTEATFPVRIGPDLTYNGGGDAFVAVLVETTCLALPAAITALMAVRDPGSRDDVAMSWLLDAGANGYNIWYVERKEDIPLARQADQPPAVAVVGCATPSPAAGPACANLGGVLRGSPALFFYQVRAFCDASSEGP